MKAAVSDLMLPILPGLHGEKTVCEYRITPSAKAYFYEIKSAPSCRILFSLSKELGSCAAEVFCLYIITSPAKLVGVEIIRSEGHQCLPL